MCMVAVHKDSSTAHWGPVLVELMRHYAWTKIVMLTNTVSVWFQSGLELARQLQDAGMKVLQPRAFKRLENQLLNEIKRSGTVQKRKQPMSSSMKRKSNQLLFR